MCVVKTQYLEMFIQCLTHVPLLKQGSLHLGNKAAMEKTLKIGSELFAYSFYHRSHCVVHSLLALDYTRTSVWLENVVAAGPKVGVPLVPSARSGSWSLRDSLWCAAYKIQMVLEYRCLKKTSSRAWQGKQYTKERSWTNSGLNRSVGERRAAVRWGKVSMSDSSA